ncbi:MAG TPA: radical SAM protein, partial [Thermoplasmata archaeon]|nr:radical SAM protein [Thermoplasmata archaeon]
MVKFEKIKRLAEESRFDSLGHGVYSSEILDLGKIKVLGQGTAKDTCGCSYTKKGRDVQPREIEEILNSGVFKASLPNGKKVSLFKTLFTNYCTHQCNYCSNAV